MIVVIETIQNSSSLSYQSVPEVFHHVDSESHSISLRVEEIKPKKRSRWDSVV